MRRVPRLHLERRWVGETAASARSGLDRAGGWIASRHPLKAVSPKRLLKWAALRAAVVGIKRHPVIAGAGVGVLALIGAGGYFAGRHARA